MQLLVSFHFSQESRRTVLGQMLLHTKYVFPGDLFFTASLACKER